MPADSFDRHLPRPLALTHQWAVLALLALPACRGCGGADVTALSALLVPDAATIDLGDAYLGAAEARPFALQSVGTGRVQVRAVELVPADPASASGVVLVDPPALPAGVAPGAALALTLSFTPDHVGAVALRLRVTSDALNNAVLEIPVTARGLAPLECDDDNACTDEAFDPQMGACTRTENTAPCDDGSACTTDDTCGGGVCRGVPLPCIDETACTIDVCDAVRGCVFIPDDAVCDDGNPCTLDACGADSGCFNTPSVDGTPCGTVSMCQSAAACLAGVCTGVSIPDGVPCNDGDLCTVGDACAGGTCVGARANTPPALIGRAIGFGARGGGATPLHDGRVLFADIVRPDTVAFTVIDPDTDAAPVHTAISVAGTTVELLAARTGGAVLKTDAQLLLVDVDPDGSMHARGSLGGLGGSLGKRPHVADARITLCSDEALAVVDTANADAPVLLTEVSTAGCTAVVGAGEHAIVVVTPDGIERRDETAEGLSAPTAMRATGAGATWPCAHSTALLFPGTGAANPDSLGIFVDPQTLDVIGTLAPAPEMGVTTWSGAACAVDGESWAAGGLQPGGHYSTLLFGAWGEGPSALATVEGTPLRALALRGRQLALVSPGEPVAPQIYAIDVDGLAVERRTWPGMGTSAVVAAGGAAVYAWSTDGFAELSLAVPQTPTYLTSIPFYYPADAVLLPANTSRAWALPAPAFTPRPAPVIHLAGDGLRIADAARPDAPTQGPIVGLLGQPGRPSQLTAGARLTLGVSGGAGDTGATLDVMFSPPSADWLPFLLAPLGQVALEGTFAPGEVIIALDDAGEDARAALAIRDVYAGWRTLLVDLADLAAPQAHDIDAILQGDVADIGLRAGRMLILTAGGPQDESPLAGDTLSAFQVGADGTVAPRGTMHVDGASHILLLDGRSAVLATAAGLLFVDVTTDPPRQVGDVLPLPFAPSTATMANGNLVLGSTAGVGVVSPPCPPLP